MIWRRFHWLNDGILPLLMMTVRLCWLWPWLEMLRRWLTPAYPTPWLPLWSIPALLLGGTLVTRLALAQTSSLRLARAWVAGIGLGAVLTLLWWQYARDSYALTDLRWFAQITRSLTDWQAALPPPALTLLFAVGLWLRSVLDGRRPPLRDDFWQTAATGFIAFALLLIAGRIDAAGLPPYTEAWMVALIAVSMSSLALSSLELARNFGDWKTPKQPQPALNRDWLMSVGFVITAVLAIGLALGALITPATVAYAFGWVGVLLRWVAMLIGYVVLAATYVLFLFLTPLFEWLRARLAEGEPPEPLSMGDVQQPAPEFASQPGLELPPLAAETIRWLGMAGVLLLIIILFALALRYFRRGREDTIDETRETILTRALLQEQLSSLWRNWRARLRQPFQAQFSPYLTLEGEQADRRTIRALYQALLAQTKQLGSPRIPAQTPTEYQALLAQRWPDARNDWQTMTDTYVAARYGLQPPSTEQIEGMRQAWEQAQATLTAEASVPDLGAQTPEQDDGEDAPPPDRSG